MSEIINLRQARKARARAEDRARADANAARFGESKAEKARRQAEARLTGDRLEAHRRAGATQGGVPDDRPAGTGGPTDDATGDRPARPPAPDRDRP